MPSLVKIKETDEQGACTGAGSTTISVWSEPLSIQNPESLTGACLALFGGEVGKFSRPDSVRILDFCHGLQSHSL